MCPVTFVHPTTLLRVPQNSFVTKHTLPAKSRPTRLIRHAKPVRAVIAINQGNYNTDVEPRGDYIYKCSNGLTFQERALQLKDQGVVSSFVLSTLISWCKSYQKAVENNPNIPGDPAHRSEIMFSTLLELCRRGCESPIQFKSVHIRIRQPFDYYKFGFEFASVLFDYKASSVFGQDNVHLAVDYANQGHNVIFLSNHQSEGDPFAIDLLLRWIVGCEAKFCEEMYFMAGDRVRDDPVVMPFSAGRNLLTVFSKKHLNDEPELREYKMLHNKRTLSQTMKMFKEGGHVVWMAPSGGRDRRNSQTGHVEISEFDDSSIDMMKLTAFKSGKPCHFFPMALWTYDMLPPPSKVGGAEKGEERVVNFIPMHMYVGEEINWESIVSPHIDNKIGRRIAQRDYIQKSVEQGYSSIGGYQY